jgi:hypothetical protein
VVSAGIPAISNNANETPKNPKNTGNESTATTINNIPPIYLSFIKDPTKPRIKDGIAIMNG